MNIAEILKNTPRGTKLYSPVFGECELKGIHLYGKYPIVVATKDATYSFTKEGLLYSNERNGECMLFPSRENRDWNTFILFKKGDILITHNNQPFIFNGEINKFKVCGSYCGIDTSDTFWKASEHWTYINRSRIATEEEKKAFFIRLKKEGYEWDACTLTLKSVKMFDINTLKPFDKVLVRDTSYNPWRCAFFDSVIDNREYKFRTTSSIQSQCIPYNEETRHLVGTKEDCPEYYKTW